MKKKTFIISIILVGAFVAGPALAQDPIIFPAKGQSQDQLEKDKFACYNWAMNEAGFDPMRTPTASSPPPSDPGTSASPLRGAAGGAVAGLAIGSLSGNAGRGAAIGAAGGGLVGGMRRRSHRQQQQQRQDQWAQQEAANYQRQRDTYNRAFGACMESKGYTVRCLRSDM